MNGIEAIRIAFESARTWFDGTVADVTREAANALPEGRVHPIGELMAHVLHAEDALVARLWGTPPAWERDGWGERLDLPMVLQHDFETARNFRCDPADLRDYSKAVYANTDAYFASLTDADLDRELDLPVLGKITVGRYLLFLILGNTLAHTGEISALKGIQGHKGYPF